MQHMRLAVGLWGVIRPFRLEARSLMQEDQSEPPSAEALAALAKFTGRHGPGSLVIIGFCYDDNEERAAWRWLVEHRVLKALHLTMDGFQPCHSWLNRVKIAETMEVTHYLDTCATLLGQLPTGMSKFLFKTGGFESVETDSPIIPLRSWAEFEHRFEL